MGTSISYCTEVQCKLTASRFFEGGIVDSPKYASKAWPMISKIVDQHGFFRTFYDVEGSLYGRYRIELFDRENFNYKYSIIEGEELGKKYSSAKCCYELTPSPDGGCVCKLSADYSTIPGVQFTEKDVEILKEETVEFVKNMEKYLIENSDADEKEHNKIETSGDKETGTVIEFTEEIALKVNARRMFQVWCMDVHNAVLKIMPEEFIGASLLEGDGGVGTIKIFNFTEAIPYSYVKERVDALDKENFEWEFTIIEGGDVGKKITWGVHHLKFVPCADGGCIFKGKAKYNIFPGVDVEEYIKAERGYFAGISKAIEAYLLEHPDLYA